MNVMIRNIRLVSTYPVASFDASKTGERADLKRRLATSLHLTSRISLIRKVAEQVWIVLECGAFPANICEWLDVGYLTRLRKEGGQIPTFSFGLDITCMRNPGQSLSRTQVGEERRTQECSISHCPPGLSNCGFVYRNSKCRAGDIDDKLCSIDVCGARTSDTQL